MCHPRAWARLLFTGLLFFIAHAAVADDWSQWRGPGRANVSAETGLLREWPDEGPKLLWKAVGIGEGVASVAVAERRAFTLGYRDDLEFVTALDVRQGKQLWSTKIGPAVPERGGCAGFLSERRPWMETDCTR